MALDFSMMRDEAPVASVAIPVDSHHEIIRLAEESGATLILRMHDYYGDARFEVAELQPLDQELTEILKNLDRTGGTYYHVLSELLARMRSIVAQSIKCGRTIEVLAD